MSNTSKVPKSFLSETMIDALITAMFPQVVGKKFQSAIGDEIYDYLDALSCRDCRRYRAKNCKGKGFKGILEIVDKCITKKTVKINKNSALLPCF